MPTIIINTEPSERDAVLRVIEKLQGQTIPVSKIAKEAGLTHSRTRYAIDDLVAAGRIIKTPTRKFNEHYVRYAYAINESYKDTSAYAASATSNNTYL